MTDPSDALRDLANAMGDDPDDTDPAQASDVVDAADLQPVPPQPPAGTGSTRPESPINPNPARPEAPLIRATEPADPGLASASALAALSGSTSAAYDPAATSQARHRRLTKPDTGMMQFRSASVPVLITVGLIMIALGVWGLLVKAGNTTLPMADRPDAGNYAILALVGLPLGILLLAGAGFFLYQLSHDKKKLKAYEEAKKAQRRG